MRTRHIKRIVAVSTVLVAASLAASTVMFGCATKHSEALWVSSDEDKIYWTETRETIRALYYELSDKSMSFVRLQLPDGTVLTLPQVMAASGVRYSDDFSYEWWTKGQSASLEKRNAEGEWETKYRNCVLIRPSSP